MMISNFLYGNSYYFLTLLLSFLLLFIIITQALKKSGMTFTREYTTRMDFEPLNPNPVSEFPLVPPVFP